MERFEVEGKAYIYHNGNYFDESYCKLCNAELRKVIQYRNNDANYEDMTYDELLDTIKIHKDNEIYVIAKSAAEFCLRKFGDDDSVVKTILPILSSCYRKLNQPNEAIGRTLPYMNPSTSSPALFTSLAAAYCDIGDYVNAKRYAGKAYARVATLPNEYKIEISNVYARLRAILDDEKK